MSEPLIYNNKSLDKGIANSSEFNGFIMDVLQDMNSLSDAIQENDTMLDDTTSMIRHENDALLSRVLQLEYYLQDVSDSLVKIKSGMPIRTMRSSISNPEDIPGFANFTVEDMYNVGMPSVFRINDKFRVQDSPVPDLLVTATEVLCNTAYTPTIFDNPDTSKLFTYDSDTTPELLYMFDGSQDLFFTRTALSQSANDNDALYVSIEITVPKSIVNNLYANCLKIVPIPKYTLDIMSIEYMDALSGTWKNLPTYPLYNNIPVPMTNISSTLITFPRIELSKLRFVIKQPKKLKVNSSDDIVYSEFFYGFQELSLQQIDITTNPITFVSKFTLDSPSTFFKIILDPEVITDGYLNQDIACTFKLYTAISNGVPYNSNIDFNVEMQTDYNTVYIETTLTPQSSSIPVVKGLKLRCEIKDKL